jgi:tetratricopeptide (TPR) repeat protein
MSVRLCCAVLFCGLLTADVGFAADAPAPTREIVSLAYREAPSVTETQSPPPFLMRELIRQAFLNAARDQCAAETRDAILREELPDAATANFVPFDLYCSVDRVNHGFDVSYTLSRRKGDENEKLDEWKFRTDVFSPKSIPDLVEEAERLSRTKFKTLLEQQGLGKAKLPAKARESADVPADARPPLWEWNEFAVASGLRRIHAEIREKGASPELLGGLVVGYANLGTLTEYYYCPACKAFYARALLYAERLMQETAGSERALWHRAYARMMVGLHDFARNDIQAAKKAADKKSAKPLPFWTEIISAFCDGQLPRMRAAAKTPDQKHLVAYLSLQAVMYSPLKDISLKAGVTLIGECPDCIRAGDALCSLGEIGPMAMVTDVSFTNMSKIIRSRLPEIYKFPEPLAKRLRDSKPYQTGTENALEDEIEFREKLMSDLKAETAAGRDTGEPSLGALARMVDESQVAQAMRRLYLEGFMWGWNSDERAESYRLAFGHHPCAAFVDCFSRDKSVQQKALQTLVHSVDPSELSFAEFGMVNLLRHRGVAAANGWAYVAGSHADPVFQDKMAGIGFGYASTPDEKHNNGPYMDGLLRASSRLPSTVAMQITRNWRKATFFAGTAEKDFADDPIVISALAGRYLKLNQYDDAERCAKQSLQVAPDFPTYETLAEVYKAKGDMAAWQQTLDKALDLPDMGLRGAIIRNRIAQYHMDRKEWKEAVGYADAAAESASEWSMLSAAICHEMLGEWQKAEGYKREISNHYSNSAMEWMLWCHRTGHGDTEGADACARAHFESLGTSFYWQTRQQIGVYYVLRKEPDKALVVFNKTFEESHDSYDAMHAALLADELGKTDERDQLLEKIIAAGEKTQNARAELYKDFVEQLGAALRPAPLNRINFEELDQVISKAPKEEAPANFEYFAGVFLLNHGNKDKSRDYLIRAAQSTLTNKYNHVLARKALRDLKIPLPSPAAASESSDKKSDRK